MLVTKFLGIFQVIEFALRTFSSAVDFYVNDSYDGQDERGQKNSRSTDRTSYRMNHTKLTSGLRRMFSYGMSCSLNNLRTGHVRVSYYYSLHPVRCLCFYSEETIS